MTTIAYDGFTVAADRCVQFSVLWSKGGVKIRKGVIPGKGKRPFVVGAAGDGFYCERVMDAILGGTEMPPYAEYGSTSAGEIVALVAQKGSVWVVSAGGDWMQIHEKILAIGAGNEIAVGAMEAGADAIEAVRIVSRRSGAADKGIDALPLE